MSNRAVIAFQDASHNEVQPDSVGIYLHWNGGPQSVVAFLDAAKYLGVRREDEYGAARLCQIIGNWFGGNLSIGIGTCRTMDTDNGDNGTYVVDLKNHGWGVAGRIHGGDRASDNERGFQGYYKEILAEVLEVNRPIFQPEKVAS
jgi:hypothetical protein